MKKHLGDFDSCEHCQKYIRLGEGVGDGKGYAATTRRLHKAAINRRAKDDLMVSCGLVKVRGAVSGKTYWE